jgi:hypothetical protein
MSAALISRAGWRLVKAGWKPGPAAHIEGAALVSLTDFTFARWRDLPGAWLAGARLRHGWPKHEGAVGLMLWVQPFRRRSGSISIWRGEAELQRFISTPEHVAIMRGYETRMSGTATTWHTERFIRAEVLDEARRRVLRGPALDVTATADDVA